MAWVKSLDRGGERRIMEESKPIDRLGDRRLLTSIGGRTRIDRMSEVTGGVSRLVSRPRKKRTKTLVANNNVGLRLAA